MWQFGYLLTIQALSSLLGDWLDQGRYGVQIDGFPAHEVGLILLQGAEIQKGHPWQIIHVLDRDVLSSTCAATGDVPCLDERERWRRDRNRGRRQCFSFPNAHSPFLPNALIHICMEVRSVGEDNRVS
jgi:hypothetical protein